MVWATICAADVYEARRRFDSMKTRFGAAIAMGLTIVTGACGGGGSGDGGVVYQMPQIYPDNNPQCLGPQMVGQTFAQNVLLQNEGKQDLQIASATIAMDARHAFKLMGPNVNTVQYQDFAVVELLYTPPAPGWDAVALQVRSNAQNYPRLDIYVLGQGVPASLDGGVFDSGPPPMTATQSTCSTSGSDR
jgi:hypothetical protein